MTDKKVALVTGSSSGIGATIVDELLARDYSVVSAQRTTPARTDVDFIAADLASASSCEDILPRLLEKHGRLDALVNNAGMMREAKIEDTSTELWNKTLAVNLRAPFLLIRSALPALRKNRGCIVNIGSIESAAGNPGHSAYGASKAGLHALTRATAIDYGTEVRCNTVAPGWINTPLNEDFIAQSDDPERFRDGLARIHPSGRTGEAGEVAKLVAYLLSDDASFINGQVFTIDGGRTIQLSLPHY